MINLTATTSTSFNAQRLISDSKQESSIEMAESANITITSIDGDGVAVTLSESSQSYFHLNKVQAPEIVAPAAGPVEQSARQTSQNIIEPVREKLSEAKDAGADRKELRGLLRDAYRGFKQGFREAVKTIHHSGNMDSELRVELRETRQHVRQEFKILREEFLPRRRLDSVNAGANIKPADQPSALVGSQEVNPPETTTDSATVIPEPDTLTARTPGADYKLEATPANNPPGTEETAVDNQSVVGESGADRPVVKLPVSNKSVIDKPAIDNPVVDKSVAGKPREEQKTDSLPANSSSVSFKQATQFNQSFAMANRNAYSELENLAQSLSASYNRSQSAVIEITTQDGDTISIDLASAIKASKSLSGNGDFEFSLAGQSSNSFIIDGELDAEELEALNSVLDQVDELAGKFFNGDVAAAFEEAMNIGLDPNEIASFSLALNQSTTIEASRAYLENDSSDRANEQLQKQSRLLSLGGYVADMQKAMESASTFSNAANMVEKLLDKAALLHHEHQPQEKRDLFNQLNENILGNLHISN